MTYIKISDTILLCLTSCFVLFCLPSVSSLLSIYHSLSIYLLVCLPVLSNLHFGIDFGRNDPGPNRPTYLGRNDPPQNWAETTQAETTQAETTQGRNDPDSRLRHRKIGKKLVAKTHYNLYYLITFKVTSIDLMRERKYNYQSTFVH